MTKRKKIISQYLLLSFIIFISFLLRFYRLKFNTPSLYSDELGHLEMLYLLKQPLSFSNLIGKVLNIPFTFTWAFGPTVYGIRFGAALYGSLIPLFTFFFVKSLNKKDIRTALISSALTAILPWSYMISRGSHTHIPIITILVLIHLILFIKASNLAQHLTSLLPLFFAAIYYPSIIIISVIVIPFYVYRIYTQIKTKKQKQLVLVVSLAFLLAVGGVLFTRYSGFTKQSRGTSLVITNDINVTAETNLYRGYSQKTSPSVFSFGLPTEKIANKLLYNFPTAVIRQFIENYLSFFSPDFLFLTGDYVLRHSTNQFGAFFPILLPFMVYGIFTFFSKANKKNKQLLLLWVIVSPIPAAITNDGARYLLRVVTLLPILTYFSALGMSEIISLCKGGLKKITSVVLSLLVLFSAYSFFFSYFHVYPTLSAKSYEYGFQELSNFQVENDNQAMLVLWQGHYPNSYFRYYQETSLSEYLQFKINQIQVGDSMFYQTFGNLYFSWPKSKEDLDTFLDQHQVSYIAFPRTYLLNNPQYQSPDTQPTSQILFPDQSPAFTIFKAL